MEEAWLSVIVPSHNGQRWLSTALQSIADQKECGIEVIVIDSSTEDASLAIAESFSTQFVIRALRRPDLLPWMAKTNFGVEQAKGKWICMLHQDDLWLPNRSAELQHWLLSQPDAVMHLHPCYIVDEGGRRLGLWRCPLPADGSPVPAQLLYERLLVQNFYRHPNAGNPTRRLPYGGRARQGAVVYCRLGPLSEDRVDRQYLLPFDSTGVLSGPQEFTYCFRKSGYSRLQKTTYRDRRSSY